MSRRACNGTCAHKLFVLLLPYDTRKERRSGQGVMGKKRIHHSIPIMLGSVGTQTLGSCRKHFTAKQDHLQKVCSKGLKCPNVQCFAVILYAVHVTMSTNVMILDRRFITIIAEHIHSMSRGHTTPLYTNHAYFTHTAVCFSIGSVCDCRTDSHATAVERPSPATAPTETAVMHV